MQSAAPDPPNAPAQAASDARRAARGLARRSLPPLAIAALGLALSAFVLRTGPETGTREPAPEPASVEVLAVQPETVQLSVRSQGTVGPRTESDLAAEVAGRVRRIGRGLEPGAFFRAGEVLVRLDDRDHQLALRRARAALARAEAEEAFVRSTWERQRALRERGIASDAAVDEALRALRSASARREEVQVDVESAERDLERTRILAPYDGRTRQRSIDIGRFVSVGTPLARVYAVDFAEVRLPVPDSELAFLSLPLGETIAPERAPQVVLEADFAGERHRWTGRIVRTEAEIDPRTRMVHVVARVADPYRPAAGEVPLAVGLYVEAEILGRRVEGVFRVPRAALQDDTSLWLVDADERLVRRDVEVLRLERDSALVGAGLVGGELVSLAEPRLAREGTWVRPVRTEAIARSGRPAEPAS